MNLIELQHELDRAGVIVKVEGGRLLAAPGERLTPGLRKALQVYKATLLALLEPARSDSEGMCPFHWSHIPLLPPKGELVATRDEHGEGCRYRVRLFDRWYIVRFETTVEAVSATDAGGKRRVFIDLDELYRWAWAERFHTELKYRTVN